MLSDENNPSTSHLGVFLSRSATLPIQIWQRLGCPETLEILLRVFSLEEECDEKRPILVDGLYKAIPSSSSHMRRKLLKLKRHIYNRWEPLTQDMLDISSQILVAELLDNIKYFNNLLRKRTELLHHARELFEKYLKKIYANLLDILKDPFIQEGILLSSHDLWEATIKYIDNPPQPSSISKSQRQFIKSITEHLARCCAKTTPRGTLTAVQLGKVDPGQPQFASLNIDNSNKMILERKTVLSWSIVWDLARMVSEQKDVWRYVIPRVNPFLHYDEDGQWKFWKQDKTEEILFKITPSEIMKAFIKKVRIRSFKAGELIRQVQGEFPDYDLEEITNYYSQLTKSGLLIGYLEIPFTYFDGLAYLIRWTKALPEGTLDKSIVANLERIQKLCMKIDEEN